MDPKLLFQRYLIGEITEAETNELDGILANDAELRREFVVAAAMETGLREIAFERAVEPEQRPVSTRQRATWKIVVPAVLASIAAAIMAMIALGPLLLGPTPVATLASSENAAWESSLPTTAGSELAPGALKLISGIATIRFRSGAEVTMEAPADLVLISPMRGKLVDGAVVVSVPEPAIGFVLETPDGYVVDHGTQFAVNVAGEGNRSDFDVIEGEITVHLSSTDEEVRLTDRQSASISERKLTMFDGHSPERTLEQIPRVLRIGTDGRATSVVRNNNRKKRLHPDMLMVKRTESGTQDRRSIFSFDVSQVDLDSVKTARLRLNLIPTGVGFANRLPKTNRFSVYGMTNEAKRDWKSESLWEESPNPEDGVLLGTFEIPRSQKRGSFGIENDKLLEFVKTHRDGPITLILVRETGQIEGEGPGLVHGFASDSHPEAAGPVLEFSLN